MTLFRMLLAVVTMLLAGGARAHGSLVELSVYDRTEGRRLPVYWHEGRAWMAGKPGNEYQVALRSREPGDVLAVVSVDAVNVITGETAHYNQSGYVLSPRGTLDILGWRKNLGETAAFYFTALPDSYAARTGRPDNVGVIGVAVFRRKVQPVPLPRPKPYSEAPARRGSAEAAGPLARSQRDDTLGTGHGRREHSPAVHVAFERATAHPAELITLHYDSHANLVARGVIRHGTPPVAPLPRPFPGFVPDPAG